MDNQRYQQLQIFRVRTLQKMKVISELRRGSIFIIDLKTSKNSYKCVKIAKKNIQTPWSASRISTNQNRANSTLISLKTQRPQLQRREILLWIYHRKKLKNWVRHLESQRPKRLLHLEAAAEKMTKVLQGPNKKRGWSKNFRKSVMSIKMLSVSPSIFPGNTFQ